MSKKLLLLVLIFPISVKAACTSGELTRLKNFSSNVNTYYDYNEQESKFNVTVYNLSNELKIVNKNDNNVYQTNDKLGQINIGNLNPGENIILGVYPKDGECNDYRIRTIYVTLPYYNKYYTDEVCKNNSSNLCSKWVNTSGYTYEEFVSKVKKEQQQEEVITPEPEPVVNKYGFFDFLGDFYIPILLFIIISGSIAIYFLDKKNKFDF